MANFLTPTNKKRRGVPNELNGVFRGVIEFNLDPLSLGRCKIRIPNLHSTEQSIETENLPWAIPAHLNGGYHDGGSFMVPPVGATVFVMFEMGDPQHPLYFGTWYKNPTEQREINTKTSKETGKVLPKRPISMGTWKQPIGPEVPRETLLNPYLEPLTNVLLKTQKGHTIFSDDKDGEEQISIIDRSGQILKFSGPVTSGFNNQNKEQRKFREASSGDALVYEKLEGQTSTVELLGTTGQGVRIVSSPDSEFIEITSKDDSSSIPGEGENKLKVLIGGNVGVFEISGVSNNEETVRLVIDSRTGSVEIKGTTSINLIAESISLESEYTNFTGNVSINGSVSITDNLLLSGDLIGG